MLCLFVSYVVFKKTISDNSYILKLRIQISSLFWQEWRSSAREHMRESFSACGGRNGRVTSLFFLFYIYVEIKK